MTKKPTKQKPQPQVDRRRLDETIATVNTKAKTHGRPEYFKRAVRAFLGRVIQRQRLENYNFSWENVPQECIEDVSAIFDAAFPNQMICEIMAELERARLKFPDTAGSMTALTEEVGELAKALLDEPWDRVRAEAIQVAVMAIRVATEGDQTLDEIRKYRGADK